MIDESNISEYVLDLTRTKIFQRDIKYIVYGEDLGESLLSKEPPNGDTPYLKCPEEEVWLRIVKIENL